MKERECPRMAVAIFVLDLHVEPLELIKMNYEFGHLTSLLHSTQALESCLVIMDSLE